MITGRPKKPTELKKIQGTYRKDRDAKNVDVVIMETDVIIPKGTKINCPKSIKTRYVKKYWKTMVTNLETLHLLSHDDLPQLETLCITLEKLREIQETFVMTSVLDDSYDDVERRFIRLSNKFDLLAAKYYVSPQSRMQLKLEGLQAVKQEIDIQKQGSAINDLLNMRKLSN